MRRDALFLTIMLLALAFVALSACGGEATTLPPATTQPSAVPPTSVPAKPTEAGVPAADVAKLVGDKFNTVDTKLALWAIQPGLGTVMIEYSNRLARMWFAANADNWDMAKYQLDEMVEIQEVAETTRPKRAPMLKAFEDSGLATLDKAIAAKDKTAFTAAFKSAVDGCNACHTASTGTNWKSYQYVNIQVPKNDPAYYIDWKGGGQDNYIANPPPGPTAAPGAALTGNLDAAGVEQLVDGKFNAVDTKLALWNIQPGLGTVMIEYSNRLSRVWFAAEGGNWDMAKYQLDEMTEIQEVAETTRPKRAPMLKAFEDSGLKGLDEAIAAQDKTKFETAFKAAVDGCNACHAASTGSNWKSYRFVKIQVPQKDNSDFIVWKAAKSTGNYVASPAAGPTPTAKPAPTGTLDMAGVEQLVDGKFNTPDTSLALWAIQPGLGTVMIEYSNRLARLAFAAQAGNWDMAKYQLDEMTEIQEVGETTRPKRAPMLKAFEDSGLKGLDDAITAQDKAKFDTAFKTAVNGCNACHTASTGSNWKSYGFVQIQPPVSDPADFVNWHAPKGTGNYIATPPTSTQAPTACDESQKNPFDWADASAIAAGKDIYTNNCVLCHGADGKGTLPGAPDFSTMKSEMVANAGEHLCTVIDGKGAMPSFNDKLKVEQIWQALTYIASLAK